MVRASLHGDAADAVLRLDVSFNAVPCAAEVQHALSALTAACRTCWREVNVLCADAAAAREYLTVRGWSPGR
jgi:hypothetical protein